MFTTKTPWVILLLLWMGGSTWWHLCRIKQLCVEAPTPAVARPVLTINDVDQLSINVPGNFSYAKSGVAANAAGVGTTLTQLADYLKTHPQRMLTVEGYYQPDETALSMYSNLGAARADAIKAELLKAGVSPQQVTTQGKLLTDATADRMPYNADRDSLYGGLNFTFVGKAPDAPVIPAAAKVELDADTVSGPIPKTEQALAEAQKFTSVLKPMDLYFKSGQSGYIQTEDTKAFFREAETYLKSHKNNKLRLTGHTDDMGSEEGNLDLSRTRANGVKRRLQRTGIDSEQIVVEAKGETEPKESNDTWAGRKANRRVTVVVY